MGAKLFVPNWDHAAAGKLRLGLIKDLGAGIGNGDRWLDRSFLRLYDSLALAVVRILFAGRR